jgi:hypothetical protein
MSLIYSQDFHRGHQDEKFSTLSPGTCGSRVSSVDEQDAEGDISMVQQIIGCGWMGRQMDWWMSRWTDA